MNLKDLLKKLLNKKNVVYSISTLNSYIVLPSRDELSKYENDIIDEYKSNYNKIISSKKLLHLYS